MRNFCQTLFIILFSLPICQLATAQEKILNGFVLELNSSQPMELVEITNLTTGKTIESDREGKFSIAANKNELLRFAYPGYRTDTIVVIEFDLKRVYMTPTEGSIRIDEVQVRAMTDSRLATEIEKARVEGEYAESSQQRGGLRLSLSRIFGKSGRQARQRYELLVAERDRRNIEARFSPLEIQKLTPLKDRDLELFMAKYKPTAAFASSASDEDMRIYIMDSYTKFNALSEEERAAIQLPSDKNQ